MNNNYKQFKKLQSVAPSEEWLKNTRNFLISRVEKDTLERVTPWSFKLSLSFTAFIKKITPSPVKAVSSMIIIVLIGGTNFVAQAEYMPSRPLYAVKRTIEKLELVLAISPESEAKVYLKHATERKNEAVKLAQNEVITPQEKDENINTVTKSLAKDINAAQNSLDIVKDNTNTQPGETAHLAMQITQNVQENIQALNEVKVAASSPNIEQAVNEVQESIEKAENASLAVLIDGTEKDDQTVSKDEVKQVLNNKINRTGNKIEELSKKADAIETAEVENDDDEIFKKAVSEAVHNSTEAQKILGDAKHLLENGSLAETLSKVKEITEITDKTKQLLVKVVNTEPVKEPTLDSPTSTGGIIKGMSTGTKNIIKGGKEKADNASTSQQIETTPSILNYAPMGGPINQTASYTEEYLPEDPEQDGNGALMPNLNNQP